MDSVSQNQIAAADRTGDIARAAEAKASQADQSQDVAKERLQDLMAEKGAVDQKQASGKKKKSVGERDLSKVMKEQAEKAQKGEGKKPKEDQNAAADQINKRNPEMKQGTLKLLLKYLGPDDDSEEILKKAKDFFPDATKADDALEFLELTTDGELHEQVVKAREEHRAAWDQDITAGRNVQEAVTEFATKGLGSPDALRNLYRDIINNPRPVGQLFKELSGRFKFGDLKKVARFLFNAIGQDLKSKKTSIPRGELGRLMQESRAIQSILQVYRFFGGRMKLVRSQFLQNKLEMPTKLSFESLAKGFMKIAEERYPNADKVDAISPSLGIEKSLQAKIIAISQMRDAVREVNMDLIFETVQRRDEVFDAILEALEGYEVELEDEEYAAEIEIDKGMVE